MHVGLIKAGVLGIALFAFGFGMMYRPNQYVAMWGAITASVFVAGAGSAIIGGLYWRRGSTAAAWCAMLTGIGLSLYGILAKDDTVKEGLSAWMSTTKGRSSLLQAPLDALGGLRDQRLRGP